MERTPATFQVSGAALRATRMRQGLGMQETADAAGISRSYLVRLETGTRERMRLPRYIALRTALNSTDNDLLAPREDSPEKR